jgi:hypothetical protein
MSPVLPSDFSELEPFAAKWCRPTEAERYAERLASSMEEMQSFYDACFPRLRPAMAHLDRFSLRDLPPTELNLLYLTYSLIMVSLPVEVWRQPRVIDAGTAYFDRCEEPVP